MSDTTLDQGADELLYFNGINGESREYDLPPMSAAELSNFIKGESSPENLSELRYRHESKGLKHLGVKEGVDPKRLDESGWGIIFAHDADPAIQEALGPLLQLRQGQTGERFRVYADGDGYRPGESKSAWLARAPRKMGPGPADPDQVPYYLLWRRHPRDGRLREAPACLLVTAISCHTRGCHTRGLPPLISRQPAAAALCPKAPPKRVPAPPRCPRRSRLRLDQPSGPR